MALAALLVIVIVAGFPLLSTGLRSIDDHEYLTYRLMNPTGSPWTALLDASYRSIGELDEARWRPLYHFGRSLTTALISDATSPRYLWRLFLTAFVAWGLATRVIKIVTPTLNDSRFRFFLILTGGLLNLSIADWADITARLGPQELFALFGLTITLLSLHTAPRTHHQIGMITGVLVMCGYKENFPLLASLLLVAVLVMNKAFRRQKMILLGIAISIVSSLISFSAVRLRGGLDVYDTDRSLKSMANSFVLLLDSVRFEWSAILLVISLALSKRGRRPLVSWLGIFVFGLLATEWLIYGESMDVYGRYAAVSDLAVALLLATSLISLCARFLDRPILKPFMLAGLIVLSTILAATVYRDLRAGANYAARESASWIFAIDEIVGATNRTNVTDLLIVVDMHDNPGRYEKSLSLITFLSFYTTTPLNIYLAVQEPPGDAEPNALSVGLEERSALGEIKSRIWRTPTTQFSPLADLTRSQRVLCVHYSSSGRDHRYSASCVESIRFTQ